MKLTKIIREAFVRAAMSDVPQVDYEEKIRKAATEAQLAALPAPVRAAYKDEASRQHLDSHYTAFGAYGSSRVGVNLPGRAVPFDPKHKAEIDELTAKKQQQDLEREALRDKLMAAAQSCTTRKALAELLPEFAKYLPADEPAALRTAPAVANLVADFTRAGWPKGAVTAQRKKVA